MCHPYCHRLSKGYIPRTRLICYLSTPRRAPTYITIEEVSLQKLTCFQDFNLTFVEYLTHVLSNYIWRVDNLVINL